MKDNFNCSTQPEIVGGSADLAAKTLVNSVAETRGGEKTASQATLSPTNRYFIDISFVPVVNSTCHSPHGRTAAGEVTAG